MISAVVLSYNDEKTIAQTLESLTWCDEVIVIDDTSTDNTVSIAKKFTSQVYIHKLENSFASQRNYGLTKATGDWVFFVDSDEIVSKELQKEIHKAVAEENCSGYYFRRNDVLFGRELKHGETSRVRLLRLAKKGAGKWERPVHEVWEVQGLIGYFENPLLHFPHPNVAQFVDDINWYSTLNATFLHDQGVPVRWWHIPAYPIAKFFLDYVWYLGFLDGTAGAVVATMMSFHSFLTRGKLWILRNQKQVNL